MKAKELEQELESWQGKLDQKEILNRIFDLLSKDPSGETQELLEIWLMTYSAADPDRVANYWKSHLENGSKVRQNTAMTFLSVLARRNLTAREILRKFLETVDLTDPYWKGLKERFDDEIYK
jgi:hypothetical protein